MSRDRKTLLLRSASLVLATALLPAVAVAGPQPDCLVLKKIQTSRDALRPGESYEVKLELESASAECRIPSAVNGQSAPRFFVILDPEPGLAADWISGNGYRAADAYGFVVRLALTLNVSAHPKVAPGDHGVAAVVSYDALDSQGVLAPHELRFRVPVKVIAADAGTQTSPPHPWDWLMLIPLVPFWILQGIVDMITSNPEC